MSKILVLADTGFGKTISASGCQEPQLGIDIKGLDRKTTFFASATSKDLPFRGSRKIYKAISFPDVKSVTLDALKGYRRVMSNDAYVIAKVIDLLIGTPFKNIVIDDANYLMQDYMMAKSLQTGWDAPKKVGHFMSKVFDAMERADQSDINIYMLAHYTDSKKNNHGDITFKMKTTGRSVEEYITPEGKFDITLFGRQEIDTKTKKISKFYVTNFDGTFPAKSAPGMFPLIIPNDLGYVNDCIEAYYHDEPMPENPLASLNEEVSVITANPNAVGTEDSTDNTF